MHLRVAAERLIAQIWRRHNARGRRHDRLQGDHPQAGQRSAGAIRSSPAAAASSATSSSTSSRLSRGESGFKFSDTIVGGAIPKGYIPSVEAGAKDYLESGPLGFNVVDVEVILKDGSYHTVDSSDMAFRLAGRLAMSEGMPECSPVLLEPIMAVDVTVPSEATPKINAMISQRRGQILGFDGREGWPGWDVVKAHIPAAEIEDLIIELRSATAGVGSYTATFDHLAELTGRLADQVLAAQKDAAE